MKKPYRPGLCALASAVLLAAGSFASCSDDGKDVNPPSPPPPPLPPVELHNQIEYDGNEPADIESAVFDVEDTDLYTFYLASAPGITDVAGMAAAEDCLSVTVRNPEGAVDTANDAFEISCKDISVNGQTVGETEKLQLSASLDKETQRLNLLVEVMLRSGKTLRAHYDGVCTEAVPQKLDNQFELDKAVSDIGSAVEWHNPADGSTAYCFYTRSGVEAPSDAIPADMQITFAPGIETTGIDLSSADPEQVSVVCGEFRNTAGTTGTLSVSKNADGSELTVALDARNGGSLLRAAYAGPFAFGYESSDRIEVTADGTSEEAVLKKVFGYRESLMNNFAFGLADADTPAGLMEGNYAVRLGLSDLNIGKTIDLATEASRCVFALYDYRNYATYDIAKASGEGVTGTITTAGTAERLYLRLSVAFPDGPAVEGEWFGDITEVGEAFDIVPVKPFVPYIKIVSPDDEIVMEKNLSVMEVRMEKDYKLRGGDPQYGGAVFDAYFFYFRPENSEDAPVESTAIVPMLMIPASYLNSTDLDLSVAQDGLHWGFRFLSSYLQQIEYSENYTMYGSTYGYCPDEAQATVVRNADKTWRVAFGMKDSYPSAWDPDRKEGYKHTITIEWKGSATKYSGTKKNDLTDEDY